MPSNCPDFNVNHISRLGWTIVITVDGVWSVLLNSVPLQFTQHTMQIDCTGPLFGHTCNDVPIPQSPITRITAADIVPPSPAPYATQCTVDQFVHVGISRICTHLPEPFRSRHLSHSWHTFRSHFLETHQRLLI